jgi:cytochrome c553
MTKHLIAISLLALGLAACSGDETSAGHGEAAAHENKSSSAGLPQGHVDAGAKLAEAKNADTGQACVSCHGADGNSPIDPTYPKLGGQYADYLAHALMAYRKGDRENALMASQAKSLTDQQIADLSAYFNSRPSQLRDLDGIN